MLMFKSGNIRIPPAQRPTLGTHMIGLKVCNFSTTCSSFVPSPQMSPAGVHAMKPVNSAIIQYGQDQRFFILLEEAVRVAETLTVSADDCVDGDLPEDGGAARLQVQESSSWSKLRFQQQQIACGASERFRAKHAEKMIILEKKIDQLSSALVAALCNQMAKAFEPHASEMLASRRTLAPVKLEVLLATHTSLQTCLASLNVGNVSALLPPAQRRILMIEYDAWMHFCRLWKDASEWIANFFRDDGGVRVPVAPGVDTIDKDFNHEGMLHLMKAIHNAAGAAGTEAWFGENHLGESGLQFLQQLHREVRVAAKKQVEILCKPFAPFVQALSSCKRSPSEICATSLVGEVDEDVTVALDFLNKAVGNTCSNLLLRREAEDKEFLVNLTIANATSNSSKAPKADSKASKASSKVSTISVEPRWIAVSVPFLALGQHVARLDSLEKKFNKKCAKAAKATEDSDTSDKSLLSAMKTDWMPSCSALGLVSTTLQKLKNDFGPPGTEAEPEPELKYLCGIQDYACQKFKAFGSIAFQRAHEFHTSGVAKVVALHGHEDLKRLRSLLDAVDKEEISLDSKDVSEELFGLTKAAVAGSLFEAFMAFDQGCALANRAKKLVDECTVSASGHVSNLLTDITALHEKNFDEMCKANEEAMISCGKCMGDLTALQALLRPLQPGEIRDVLVANVEKRIPRKKFLSLSKCVVAAGHKFMTPTGRES